MKKTIFCCLTFLLLSFSIQAEKDSITVNVPNTFSDSLQITLSNLENDVVDFKMFNRWGSLILHPIKDSLISDDYSIWIYHSSFDSLPIGTYYYILQADTNSFKGAITYVGKPLIINNTIDTNNPTCYPNPFTSIINLNKYSNILEVRILDEKGTLILTKTNYFDKSLDVSFLTKGSYLISIKTNFGLFTEKLVKE